MFKKFVYILGIVIVVFVFKLILKQFEDTKLPKLETNNKAVFSKNNEFGKRLEDQNTEIAKKAILLLEYLIKNKNAPDGYVGGRVFFNREKRLPEWDSKQQKISYQEWDINPKVNGQNRGTERLITGSDSSAYYTADHYKTFVKIKP